VYLSFFGLKENPFSLVTDPRFLYYSESHCEAMAHLLYGVRERKGIILLLGEAGTGKTTILRATLDALRSTQVVASVIFNPLIRREEELLEAVLLGFGVDGFRRSNTEMFDVLRRLLEQHARRNRIPVVIVDEAQQLRRQVLEQLRLLSNLEFQGNKLLQILLVGQPEIAERLDSHEMRALRQRIAVRCRLIHLNRQETWNYMAARIARAGGADTPIFTPAAGDVIFEYSGGIPRSINMIADNCLLAAYARGQNPVEAPVVEQVVRHLELTPVESPASGMEVPADVIRASTSWKEVVHDIRAGGVPEALRKFVEKLRTPDEMAMTSLTAVAVEKGH
jgi:general secretion pathway protein A